MNFKDLLNADHEALLQWLVQGWRWWIDELMSMVPPAWRERLLQRSAVLAEMNDERIVYRDERTAAVLASRPRGAIKVLLPRDRVLTRDIDLPVLPVNDLKRMLALDLDRLTPFRADQAFFDAEIISRNPEAGRQQVRLGVLPRSAAVAAMEQARAFGVEPAALGVVPARGRGRSTLDFLPAMRESERGSDARRRTLYWWAAAIALLAFNIFLLSYRDSTSLDQLRAAVDSQQAPVTVAMRLRDKVEKEAARRSDLLRQQAQASPLKVLDAVTTALPSNAWVSRFEWNGKTVHIRGFATRAPNLLAQLEASSLLHNARSLATDPHVVSGDISSFDLAADRRLERAR